MSHVILKVGLNELLSREDQKPLTSAAIICISSKSLRSLSAHLSACYTVAATLAFFRIESLARPPRSVLFFGFLSCLWCSSAAIVCSSTPITGSPHNSVLLIRKRFHELNLLACKFKVLTKFRFPSITYWHIGAGSQLRWAYSTCLAEQLVQATRIIIRTDSAGPAECWWKESLFWLIELSS